MTDAEGEVLERNDYSGFGKRLASSSGTQNRYRFIGKEDQSTLGLPWQDFGARMYDPDLARWTSPDPLSEHYPGISPYAYCNGDPVNLVDRDGRIPDVIWDVASIGMGIRNLVDNIKAGNVKEAIGDGAGIVVDALAAMTPFVPGGVGVVRAGVKAADVLDDAIDAAKVVNGADSAKEATKNSTRIKYTGGENSHTKLGKEMHKNYNPGEGYIKEYKLPSGKRADAVNLDKGEVRELKPNNRRSIKRGEKQVQEYKEELQAEFPDKKWQWYIDVYDK